MTNYVLDTMTYSYPYVIKSGILTKPDPLTEDTETDRELHSKLTALVMQWCSKKKIVRTDADNTIHVNIKNDFGDFGYLLSSTNFSYMQVAKSYDAFMKNISDTDVSLRVTALLNFNIQLGVLFDHRFLDRIVYRTYLAFSIATVDGVDTTWEEVHKKCPFMWLILFIQTAIQIYAEPFEYDL